MTWMSVFHPFLPLAPSVCFRPKADTSGSYEFASRPESHAPFSIYFPVGDNNSSSPSVANATVGRLPMQDLSGCEVGTARNAFAIAIVQASSTIGPCAAPRTSTSVARERNRVAW